MKSSRPFLIVTFSVVAASVALAFSPFTIIAPKSGAKFTAGSKELITWSVSPNALALSPGGFSLNVVVTSPTNAQTFRVNQAPLRSDITQINWSIPADAPRGTDYYVNLTATKVNQSSSGPEDAQSYAEVSGFFTILPNTKGT
jgi:hypothetical protein